MTTLYFMRHAQSEANLADILASQIDFPLTIKGHQDAEQIAKEFFQQHSVNKVIASPLVRAQQTATPFAKVFSLPIENNKMLIEQHLGMFSGKSYAEIEDEPNYCHDRSQRWSWVPEGGGESYSMIADRLMPFFKGISTTSEDAILVVTHAVTMRLIKSILENSLPEYPHDIAHNGEVWKVEFKGVGQSHLIESLFFGGSESEISRA